MDREGVVQAFKWILGREPENGLNMTQLMAYPETDLREWMLDSVEFREMYKNRYLGLHRFMFIRIPKTASTSVEAALEGAGMGVARINSDAQGLRELFGRNRMVSGHVTYGDVLPHLEGIRPIFVAVVRDPMARAVSLYRQARDEETHPCHDDVRARSFCEAIKLEGLFFEWVFNAQCRAVSNHLLFANLVDLMKDEYYLLASEKGLERLLRAIARLAGLPLVALGRKNVASTGYDEEIRRQPDFEEAERILAWLTTEDRKLVGRVGDFFVSPALSHLFGPRGEQFQ